MMNNPFSDPAMPQGFIMALSHNVNAMRHFSSLPKDERQRIIDKARQATSKEDMQGFVDSLLQ